MEQPHSPAAFVAAPVPLQEGADGVIRVSGTRVTLDSVLHAFQGGAAAEEIAYRFPTVPLGDIYAVISYYLQETERVDAYLARREAHAAEVRRENEARFPSEGIRERLLARKAASRGQ